MLWNIPHAVHGELIGFINILHVCRNLARRSMSHLSRMSQHLHHSSPGLVYTQFKTSLTSRLCQCSERVTALLSVMLWWEPSDNVLILTRSNTLATAYQWELASWPGLGLYSSGHLPGTLSRCISVVWQIQFIVENLVSRQTFLYKSSLSGQSAKDDGHTGTDDLLSETLVCPQWRFRYLTVI